MAIPCAVYYFIPLSFYLVKKRVAHLFRLRPLLFLLVPSLLAFASAVMLSPVALSATPTSTTSTLLMVRVYLHTVTPPFPNQLTINAGERALEQLNYSLIKGRAW